MKKVYLHNNDKIKLQGMFYYHDCYKYWDLNHSHVPFSNHDGEYQRLLSTINMGYKMSRNALHNEQFPMCIIELSDYDNNYEKYYKSVSANIRRDEKLAKKSKFYFKKYNFNHNIEDFLSINHSQNNHKKINSWYLNPKSFFDGMHSGYRHAHEDDLHFSQWYGIFKFFKHYKQGDKTTNEKLFAYCKVTYDGEMASIHLIFGDRSNLKYGIMSMLITSVVEECFKNKNIKFLTYHTWSGHKVKWKSRFLFKPEKIRYIL